MAGAQVGKTLIGKALIGYHIDHDPCPILMVQPTVEIGMVYSTDRLAPMIRDTPRLRAKVSDPKSRNSTNTNKKKTFPGGYIAIAGANSAASLGSRPVRLVIFDEVDKFPASVKKEGDPVYLGKVRTKTFHNRKSLLMSTPTDLTTSRINAAWIESDMRRFHVACPHCDGLQYLKWANVTWTDNNPDTAGYRCEHCATVWTEADRTVATSAGIWIAEHPERKRAGFHIWEIYAPWRRMSEIVAEFLSAKKQPDTLKVFINSVLGECWDDSDGEKADDVNMIDRREAYTPDTLPNGVVVVTAGIDVQDDRVELEFKGYGVGEESWGVDFVVLFGNPGRGELWDRVGDQIKRTFTRQDGVVLSLYQACIDSAGHYTQQVYAFARKHASKVRAIVGRSGPGKPIAKNGEKPPKGLGRRLIIVGVDTAKELILQSRLKIEEPGPGYMHFPISPAYGTEYFKQLTAERSVTKYKFGKPYKVWMLPSGAHNEALDVNVYALAALTIKRPNLKALAAKMQRRTTAPKAKPEVPALADERAVEPAVEKRGKTRKRSNYLAGYGR